MAAALSTANAGCVGFTAAKPVKAYVHAPDRRANGAPAPRSASAPVILDNNRMFATVTFRLPNGGERKALAWVNMGMGGMTLAPALRRALGDGSVDLEIGGMPMRVEPAGLLPATADDFAQAYGPMPVEAILPAQGLSQFRVTLDYQNRAVTLERPSDAPAPGVAVPIQVNPETGLISVTAKIDGRAYPIVVDVGGGYTWLEGHVVRGWLRRHPDWYRADGAVGQGNQGMVGLDFEQGATVARLPLIELGALQIRDVGVLGSSPARGSPVDWVVDREFWHGWGKGAPEPVFGWLGGNVLKRYRITIDYKNHVSYWLKVADPQLDDLNSVGVSLIHGAQNYYIGGLIRRTGVVSVQGVQVGDRVLKIDGRPAGAMTRGEIIAALHGAPGERHRLTLDRKGQSIQADLAVTAY